MAPTWAVRGLFLVHLVYCEFHCEFTKKKEKAPPKNRKVTLLWLVSVRAVLIVLVSIEKLK